MINVTIIIPVVHVVREIENWFVSELFLLVFLYESECLAVSSPRKSSNFIYKEEIKHAKQMNVENA